MSPAFMGREPIQDGDPGTMAWVQGIADKLVFSSTAMSDVVVDPPAERLHKRLAA
ncbi:hypothetical protein [Streptomyces sp. MMBL 11-3]|uniref:hypothetical protein n=1 Tax=Streptomyces sp. MMBL 11-3 TaxID=3382639 RepID=UPI0039B416C5